MDITTNNYPSLVYPIPGQSYSPESITQIQFEFPSVGDDGSPIGNFTLNTEYDHLLFICDYVPSKDLENSIYYAVHFDQSNVDIETGLVTVPLPTGFPGFVRGKTYGCVVLQTMFVDQTEPIDATTQGPLTHQLDLNLRNTELPINYFSIYSDTQNTISPNIDNLEEVDVSIFAKRDDVDGSISFSIAFDNTAVDKRQSINGTWSAKNIDVVQINNTDYYLDSESLVNTNFGKFILNSDNTITYTGTTPGTDTINVKYYNEFNQLKQQNITITVNALQQITFEIDEISEAILVDDVVSGNWLYENLNTININNVDFDLTVSNTIETDNGILMLNNDDTYTYEALLPGIDNFVFKYTNEDEEEVIKTLSVEINKKPIRFDINPKDSVIKMGSEINGTWSSENLDIININGIDQEIGADIFTTSNGTLILSEDHTFTYTPTAVGSDNIIFKYIDEEDIQQTISLNINIVPKDIIKFNVGLNNNINQVTIGGNLTGTWSRQNLTSININNNDYPLNIDNTINTNNGILTFNKDKTFTYLSNTIGFETITFKYTNEDNEEVIIDLDFIVNQRQPISFNITYPTNTVRLFEELKGNWTKENLKNININGTDYNLTKNYNIITTLSGNSLKIQKDGVAIFRAIVDSNETFIFKYLNEFGMEQTIDLEFTVDASKPIVNFEIVTDEIVVDIKKTISGQWIADNINILNINGIDYKLSDNNYIGIKTEFGRLILNPDHTFTYTGAKVGEDVFTFKYLDEQDEEQVHLLEITVEHEPINIIIDINDTEKVTFKNNLMYIHFDKIPEFDPSLTYKISIIDESIIGSENQLAAKHIEPFMYIPKN